jgi:hypothetical protein
MSSDVPRPEIDQRQLETIRPVLERYRTFWPLSVRQVYYQVVKEGGAGLCVDEYAGFTWTVRHALLAGLLPLVAINEDSERTYEGGAWDDPEDFLHSELESFLWGYRRNVQQGQEGYVELWVQSPELLDFVGGVAVEYCVTAISCAKLPAVKFMQDLRTRMADARERQQSPVMLFFGDFAPEERGFLAQVRETLRTDGDLWDLDIRHEALTVEDVVKYELPESVVTRPRQSQGSSEPGRVPVELAALAPDLLAQRVRAAIEAQLDMQLVNNQRMVQERELLRLGKLRTAIMRRIRSVVKEQFPPMMP